MACCDSCAKGGPCGGDTGGKLGQGEPYLAQSLPSCSVPGPEMNCGGGGETRAYGPGGGVLQLLPGGGGRQAHAQPAYLSLLAGSYSYENGHLGFPALNGGLERLGAARVPASRLCADLDGFAKGACEMALANLDLADICGAIPAIVVSSLAAVGIDADEKCAELLAGGIDVAQGPILMVGQTPTGLTRPQQAELLEILTWKGPMGEAMFPEANQAARLRAVALRQSGAPFSMIGLEKFGEIFGRLMVVAEIGGRNVFAGAYYATANTPLEQAAATIEAATGIRPRQGDVLISLLDAYMNGVGGRSLDRGTTSSVWMLTDRPIHGETVPKWFGLTAGDGFPRPTPPVHAVSEVLPANIHAEDLEGLRFDADPPPPGGEDAGAGGGVALLLGLGLMAALSG